MKRPLILAGSATLLAIVVAVGATLAVLSKQPRQIYGTLIDDPAPAADFSVQATTGETVKLSDFRGKAVALFFGYTSCPDVCPLTMSTLAQAKKKLGTEGQDLQVLFMTVDPERDTPAIMKRYVTQYDPSFIGLIPTETELEQITKTYGIFYEKEPGSTATGYLMAHTASTIVLDRQGNVRLILNPAMESSEMASDLRVVLE